MDIRRRRRTLSPISAGEEQLARNVHNCRYESLEVLDCHGLAFFAFFVGGRHGRRRSLYERLEVYQ